jgi:hypothetical protein
LLASDISHIEGANKERLPLDDLPRPPSAVFCFWNAEGLYSRRRGVAMPWTVDIGFNIGKGRGWR